MKKLLNNIKKYTLSWVLAGVAFYAFIWTDKMPWFGLLLCFAGAINLEYIIEAIKARWGKR